MSKQVCPGCNGTGRLNATAQIRNREGVYHKPMMMTCPVCEGSGSATQDELNDFLEQVQEK
jgi:DnaJ-class molecular chaperone